MIYLNKPDVEFELEYIYGFCSTDHIKDLEMFPHVIAHKADWGIVDFWVKYSDLSMVLVTVDCSLCWIDSTIPSCYSLWIDNALEHNRGLYPPE